MVLGRARTYNNLNKSLSACRSNADEERRDRDKKSNPQRRGEESSDHWSPSPNWSFLVPLENLGPIPPTFTPEHLWFGNWAPERAGTDHAPLQADPAGVCDWAIRAPGRPGRTPIGVHFSYSRRCHISGPPSPRPDLNNSDHGIASRRVLAHSPHRSTLDLRHSQQSRKRGQCHRLREGIIPAS